jgi:superfamily II DNA or RNA helicase
MKPPELSLLPPGSHVVVRGCTWTISARTPFADCTAVSLKARGTGRPEIRRTLLAPFDRFIPAERPRRLRVVKPPRLLHCLRRLVASARPAGGLPAAAAAAIDILPWQLEPALAVSAGATRILLADAVGLGKTVQAGLVVAHLGAPLDAPARVLIATPAGLREQWQHELERHFGLAAVIADTAWLARRARELPPDVNPWTLPEIYVISFDLLKRPEVLRPLEEVTWDAVVVDEAHHAAPGTARRAALDAVARRARRVLLLTATPHDGDDEAHAALLGLGAAGPDETAPLVFRRTRDNLHEGRGRRTMLLAVRPTPAERRMHRQLARYTSQVAGEARARGDRRARLTAIVLRKRALSSAASLALSASRRLDLLAGAVPNEAGQLALPWGDEDPLEDHVPDVVLAAPGLADAAAERAALTGILESARHAAADESKARRLVRLLARIVEPAIVFTEYRDTLARLAAALEAAGRRPLVLHGGQGPAERAEVQRAFNAGGRLLLATDAAAEGLNLHAHCRLVIHYELPWTPARLEQRTGRVDRIGQARRVHEILLVARDTAERLVLAPLAARAARARRALGDAPLLDRLTESHVAAAVLEGERLPPPVPARRHEGTGFRAEAEAEAERLHLARAYIVASPTLAHADSPSDIWLCAPHRHRPACQVDAVYALEVVTPDGAILHREILVARQAVSRPLSFRRAADLKRWARGWMRETEATVVRELRAALRHHVGTLGARLRRASIDTGLREAAIAAALPGEAGSLVQTGLFDRRAVHAREASRRAARDLAGELEDRRAASHPTLRLTPGLRLVALVMR